MITFQEAYNIVLKTARTIGIEKINFQNALNRVLAEDIYSDLNMPPFDKSAMDGYACRKDDLDNELTVIEIIPAGYLPQKEIKKNQCAKIMTGAPLPEGADTVVMIENTEKLSSDTIKVNKKQSKSNICYLAEDVKKGQIVLKKGRLITARHIPVLASAGATEISVFKKPKIALISTGDELVEPDVIPNFSQIRNSNAYQMIAQAKEIGIETKYIGTAKDTLKSMREYYLKAAEDADIILLSGAVSMGDYDFVPKILKEAGIKIHFHGIQVKPGKKTIFGTSEKQWFIGVPGNPVSSFVQFEMLIKPLIMKIMRANNIKQFIQLPVSENYERKSAKRTAFEPVKINSDGTVSLSEYHGSAHINALTDADALMMVEKDVFKIKKGQKVNVRPLR